MKRQRWSFVYYGAFNVANSTAAVVGFLSLSPFNPGCDTAQSVFLHVFSENILKTQQVFVVVFGLFYDDQAFVSSVNQPGSSTGTTLFIVRWQRITQRCAASPCSVSCCNPPPAAMTRTVTELNARSAGARRWKKKEKKKNQLTGGKQRPDTLASGTAHLAFKKGLGANVLTLVFRVGSFSIFSHLHFFPSIHALLSQQGRTMETTRWQLNAADIR